jgi:hypothetical protein
MALSKAATDVQRARLYVYQDHRAAVVGLPDPSAAFPWAQTVWAGPTPPGVQDLGAYLTVLDVTFDAPASQVPGDLALVQSGDDEPLQPVYQVTRPVNIFGIPFGVVIILGAAAALVVLVAVVSLIVRGVRRYNASLRPNPAPKP